MTGGEQFRTEPKTKLHPPGRKPTQQEVKKMTAIALSWLVKYIMTNFLYNFGGEDRRQEDGGPMGDELTQALSRMIGLEYDELFLATLEQLDVKLELYERYVDDQDVIGRSIGRNTKFCPATGVMKSKTEEEIQSEKDSIIPMLKTEYDSPSNHPELNFKVPILDMAVWVEDMHLPAPRMEDDVNHSKCREGDCLPIGRKQQVAHGMAGQPQPATRLVPQVNYDFYAKPIAPKTTILSSSANPLQQKRTTFTQEVIQRLLRTRKEQCCSKKQQILSEYMQVLKNSGYKSQFRKEVLDSGVKGYNKILSDHLSGIKPIYRSKEWQKTSRRMDKNIKRKHWLGS